jgi:hypothetical protein
MGLARVWRGIYYNMRPVRVFGDTAVDDEEVGIFKILKLEPRQMVEMVQRERKGGRTIA